MPILFEHNVGWLGAILRILLPVGAVVGSITYFLLYSGSLLIASVLYRPLRGGRAGAALARGSWALGVAASVPGLPGCWSQGSTEPEALANIRTAIQEYLAVVDEQTQGTEVREVEVTV